MSNFRKMMDLRQSACTMLLRSELNPPIQHPIPLSFGSRLYFQCVTIHSTGWKLMNVFSIDSYSQSYLGTN